MNPDIFRAYDIRGIYGADFEPIDFYQIARAYANRFEPKTVAVGYDVRESSPKLWRKVVEGLIDSGVDVLNLGQISPICFISLWCTTEQMAVLSSRHLTILPHITA